MKRTTKTAAFFCALIMAAGCMAGCSNKDKKSSDKADSKKSDNAKASESVTDSKVDIYLDEEGAPYYIDAEGGKMMLFATPMDEEEEDPSEYYVYDKYDKNGLAFDIPEGWYADDSYDSPTLFMDGEEDNYDEYISILPSMYVFEPDKDGNYDSESTLKSYYDDAVAEGYYLSYEITEKGKVEEKVGGADASYYVLKVSMEGISEDSEESTTDTIRIKYIITKGDNSHAIIITSLDSDESFNKVVSAYEDSVAPTLKLPTAEQMTELDSEEEFVDDEDFVEGGEDVDLNILQ